MGAHSGHETAGPAALAACAARPALVTPLLQVVQRVVTRHRLGQAGLKADGADNGAVTLNQRFGSAANLNIHRHCGVLDGAPV